MFEQEESIQLSSSQDSEAEDQTFINMELIKGDGFYDLMVGTRSTVVQLDTLTDLWEILSLLQNENTSTHSVTPHPLRLLLPVGTPPTWTQQDQVASSSTRSTQ